MFRFKDDVRPIVTNLLAAMKAANYIGRNGYAGNDDVYGFARLAFRSIVEGECGCAVWNEVEHSRENWNWGGNNDWLEDAEVAISNAYVALVDRFNPAE